MNVEEPNSAAIAAMMQVMQGNAPVKKSHHYLAELNEPDAVMSRAVRRRIAQGMKKDEERQINLDVDKRRQQVLAQRRRLATSNKRVQAGEDTEVK